MVTTIIALTTLVVGLLAGALIGAFLVHRRMAPQLEQLQRENEAVKETSQHFESMWTELVSLLDENGQLPEGAAAKILERYEPAPAPTSSQLTKRPGNSSHRCSAELARIKAGQPSLDSLKGMNSSHICSVLLARIEAGQALQHSLKGLNSSHRTSVELACANAGIAL